MSNTRIEYFYRDKSNYKQHKEVVLAGPLTAQHSWELENCLISYGFMEDCFLAEEVGLPDLRDDMGDHGPWHEFGNVSDTDQEPTSTLSTQGFIARLKAIEPKMAKLAEKLQVGDYKVADNESGEENGAIRRNTLLSYTYRDGSNNSTSREVVIEGEITDAEREELILMLDRSVDTEGRLGDFIPGQVGLPDLQDDFPSKGAWTDNDHPWHMLEELRQTALPADDDVPSLAEVLTKARELYAGHGWNEEYRPAFHEEMVARGETAPGM
jgi:hypothetical protein